MAKKRTVQNVVEELLEVINKNELSSKELVTTLSFFLFSVGASVEGVADEELDSEIVLKRYAKKPTLGNAMMAQALYMAETWITEEVVEKTIKKEKSNGRTKRNSRKN
jgi:hypothetical protein